MEYVVHRRFKDTAICGYVNLPYGTRLGRKGNYLYHGDKRLCAVNSKSAREHMARNDDEQGLKRGALTYAIAFKNTKNKGFRLTDEQRKILVEKYSHFLRTDCEYIIFNDDFIAAEIEDLQAVAKDLGIKVKY